MKGRDGTRLAVLMLDLNRFKQINDTLGHRSGDIALQVTAQRLLKSVRKTDLVARLGGGDVLIECADEAMYRAKQRGLGYTFFSPTH
nr:GGDEF domain-containing protein [Oscillochloris sp. ZM17-4]